MGHQVFQPTKEWPLQAAYKQGLHERIQLWGLRVAPLFEGMPDEDREPREKFLQHLITSVERDDKPTADIVKAVDGYARDHLEGPGMYGRSGGSIESAIGHTMCQAQFQGLYAIFEAGKLEATS